MSVKLKQSINFDLASEEFCDSSIISTTFLMFFVALDKPFNISSFSIVFLKKLLVLFIIVSSRNSRKKLRYCFKFSCIGFPLIKARNIAPKFDCNVVFLNRLEITISGFESFFNSITNWRIIDIKEKL